MDETRAESERRINEACSRGEIERAATLTVELYGREVLGFLIARLGEQAGHDVFSDLLEDFWRGLPAFEWRSTLRSWLYTLARHAIARHARSARRRRDVPIQTSSAFSDTVQRVRSETVAYLRTDVKSRFRELREQLTDDEQTLLMLRIDRDLSWRELAAVMADQDDPNEDDLDKIATRLRQRFQRAKERLRQLAEAEGLLPAVSDEG